MMPHYQAVREKANQPGSRLCVLCTVATIIFKRVWVCVCVCVYRQEICEPSFEMRIITDWMEGRPWCWNSWRHVYISVCIDPLFGVTYFVCDMENCCLCKKTLTIGSVSVVKRRGVRTLYDTARLHSLRTYHQVQNWLGNDLLPNEWGWTIQNQTFQPVSSTIGPAYPDLLKMISCQCKGICGRNCGCRKVGLHCTIICKNCNGDMCGNVPKVSSLVDEDDINDDYPTLVPLFPESSENTTESSADMEAVIDELNEAQPGPSKRFKERE